MSGQALTPAKKIIKRHLPGINVSLFCKPAIHVHDLDEHPRKDGVEEIVQKDCHKSADHLKKQQEDSTIIDKDKCGVRHGKTKKHNMNLLDTN